MIETACDIVRQNQPASGPVFYDFGQKRGKLGFLFPGQGSQYPDMGKDLFAVFPEAAGVLERAQKVFRDHPLEWSDSETVSDLTKLLFAPPPHRQKKSVSESRLRHTQAAQMAIAQSLWP